MREYQATTKLLKTLSKKATSRIAIKFLTALLYSGFCIFLLTHSFSHAEPSKPTLLNAITLTLSPNVIEDTKRFIAHRDIQNIHYYGGPHARRPVISYLLLQQAFYEAGFRGHFEAHPEMSYQRNLRYVNDGDVAVLGEPAWLSDIENSRHTLYISDATVRAGEFVVGLYTRPNHNMLKAVINTDTIKNYSAASSRNWQADWQILQQLQVKNIQHSLYWRNIVKMVYAGRADFTLAPFQTDENNTLEAYGVTLVLIPNVKVAFPGSRHFVVSREHPHGAQIFEMLQRGLKILRNKGTIARAHSEAGVFNPKANDWLRLNPDTNSLSNISTKAPPPPKSNTSENAAADTRATNSPEPTQN